MTSKVSKNVEKKILQSGLYIVSTPIGNLQDISYRAIQTLTQSDLIACEDTRVSKILLNKYGIKTKTISIHNYNEEGKINFVREKIKEGFAISLISDSGTPLICDPGYKISTTLRGEGFYVTVIPGASASISALVLSGFPTDRFLFIGFAPTKEGERFSFFEEIKAIKATTLFYETSNRLLKTLATLNKIYPDRQIAVVREITKIYEQVKTGTPTELINYFTKTPAKGELVVLIEPLKKVVIIDEERVNNLLNKLLKNMSLKDASEFISSEFAISKKIVYDLGIKLKNH